MSPKPESSTAANGSVDGRNPSAASSAAMAQPISPRSNALAPYDSRTVAASSSAPALHLHPSSSGPSSPPFNPAAAAVVVGGGSRLRAVSSVLSGEEADSEPSSAGGSLAGSTDSLSRMGGSYSTPQQRRGQLRMRASTLESAIEGGNGGRSRSGTAGSETEMDREVRMVTTNAADAAAAPASSSYSGFSSASNSVPPSPSHQKGWKISSSSLNLLLSSHLSHHFVAPPLDQQSRKPDGPSWWRRWLYPKVPLSRKGVLLYTAGSLFFIWMVKSASHRARLNRTMVTYLPPFLVREAPHLWMLVVLVGFIRTFPQLRRELNPALLLGWTANLFSLFSLARIFHRIVRIGSKPFQEAMERAGIPVPRGGKEDVLTIVPIQGEAQGEEGEAKSLFEPAQSHIASTSSSTQQPSTSTPVPSTASAISAAADLTTALTTSAVPSSSSKASPAPLASTSLPSSTAKSAYARIGRMTPLRWFLTTTQLTKTLAWAQEIQWRTGIIYETIYAKQKTHALKLDIYRPKVGAGAGTGQRLPCFLYIHGGGWITGHRSFHSLTLLYAIAKAGFMVVSVNYRLSPWVKHPTHLMDCKRALAWLRTNAREFGGDAECVIVGGESAGAHLACLLALTPNVLHLQPGLEDIDTTVQGVLDLYGCHDFTDAHFHFRCRENPHSWVGGFASFLHRMVMGHTLEDARALYEMASPYFRLLSFHESLGSTTLTRRTIPPFFLCHGSHDDLVPVEDTEVFFALLQEKRQAAEERWNAMMEEWKKKCDAIRQTSPNATLPLPPLPLNIPQDVYVRVPCASHGFNNVMSPRSFGLNDAVTVWLGEVLREHRERVQVMEQLRKEQGGAQQREEMWSSSQTNVDPPATASSRALRLEADSVEAVLREERQMAETGASSAIDVKTNPLQLLNKL